MLKVVFYFGLVLIAAAGVMGYDYSRQVAQAQGQPLEMVTYLQSVQDRAGETFVSSEEEAPILAVLPQVKRQVAAIGAEHGTRIIDDFSEYTPMMGMLLKEKAQEAKPNGLMRERPKPRIKGGALVSDMSGNLAAMRKRNFD